MDLVSINETEGFLVGEAGSVVEGGTSTFNEVFITDPGEYLLIVMSNCSDRLENFTTEVFWVSGVDNVTIEVVEPNVTIYFDFTLRITTSNDCRGVLYNNNTQKSIEYTTINKTADIRVYLENTDPTIFLTSCGGSEAETNPIFPKPLNFDLRILDSDLQISSSTNSRQPVFAQVQVTNLQGEVETKNFNKGTYPFTLTMLNNSQQFSGMSVLLNEQLYDLSSTTYQAQTENGAALIPAQFLSSGEFVLEVHRNNDLQINSDSFELSTKNFLTTLKLKSNFTTVYLPTDLEIELFGDDQNPYTQSLEIQITEKTMRT